MGKKPLITLAGLFLAGVAISATGCGQCTQCSTRPGKFHSSGPQAKAATPVVGESKRSEQARDTAKQSPAAPKTDLVPVAGTGFDRMPEPTPMKPVPPTYSGDPPPGPITPVPPSDLPGRESTTSPMGSRRETMSVPPLPTGVRGSRVEETRPSRSEEFRARPLPAAPFDSNMEKVPGVGVPTNASETRSDFTARPIETKEPVTPPAPPPPAPVDVPPRSHPAPPPLPSGIEPTPAAEKMPPALPPTLPGTLPGTLPPTQPEAAPTANTKKLGTAPATMPGEIAPPTGKRPSAAGESASEQKAKAIAEMPGSTPPHLPGVELPPLGS